MKLNLPCVVSPDAGGVTRAKQFQEKLIENGYKKTTLAMIIKQRSGPG
jgi:ribose-phosphate pyrophosphokinase